MMDLIATRRPSNVKPSRYSPSPSDSATVMMNQVVEISKAPVIENLRNTIRLTRPTASSDGCSTPRSDAIDLNVLTENKPPYSREIGSTNLKGILCKVYKA